MFIVGPLSQSEDASGVLATRAMLVVNGLLVLLALVNLGGALDTLGDTRWLKRYREEHGL